MKGAGHGDDRTGGLTVLVVEGSPVLRDRLVWLVADVPGVRAAAGVPGAVAAVASLEAEPADAILVDADDAGWPDLGDLRALRRAAPGALVVVLSADRCDELCARCAAAGADLCLSRDDLARVDAMLRGLAARAGPAPLAAAAPRA